MSNPPKTENTEENKPAPAANGNSNTSQKTLSQQEYDDLLTKARNYELIEADQELAPKILDHFRAKTGRVRQEQQSNNNQNNNSDNQAMDPRIAKTLEQQQHELARVQIALFEQKNPDMKDYRDDMAKLVNRFPNMSLEEAYSFSKAAKSQAAQKPAPSKPASATAETNDTAGNSDTDTDIDAYIKQINDPKATPRMDDVIELAWKAAKKQHSV